jgi:hypothetical protein
MRLQKLTQNRFSQNKVDFAPRQSVSKIPLLVGYDGKSLVSRVFFASGKQTATNKQNFSKWKWPEVVEKLRLPSLEPTVGNNP